MLDLLIRNARVIDGSGEPSFHGDVGVRDGFITDVGHVDQGADKVIDASDLVVCPGFVDMHAHSDLQLLVNPGHEAKVRQGVTMELIGQDGLSYAPVTEAALAELRVQLSGWNDNPPGLDWDWRTVDDFLHQYDKGAAVSIAYLVPQGTVRLSVMGADDREPSERELAEMKRLVAQGVADGAVGMSVGLTYTPGMYASDDEIVELLSATRGTGAFYCPHHRDYGAGAIEGYGACIEIARRARVPLHIPHSSLPFPVNRDRAPELLAKLDGALADGIDVTLDVYPYIAGATALYQWSPGWARDGGIGPTLARLADPQLRERLRVEFEEIGSDGFFGIPIDWTVIVVSSVAREENKRFVGKTIAEGGELTGKRPIDFFCDLLVAEELKVGAVNHVGNEGTLREILQHPACAVGSDGILVGERPHPRGCGTFPRILGVYSRELGLFSLEEAVRKMTSLPARRLRFRDRGFVRPGMAADLVCFDPETVRDTATYEDPRRPPEGIPHVIHNGQLVIDDGRHTGALPGRALHRPA